MLLKVLCKQDNVGKALCPFMCSVYHFAYGTFEIGTPENS